jgi:hypothetical protein
MGKVVSTVMVAMMLTGCAGHVVKNNNNWRGEHDDRAGATAVNLVHVPVAGVNCAIAGLFSFVAVLLDGHEEASRIMHNNCNADNFIVSSKDIRQAVPVPLSE